MLLETFTQAIHEKKLVSVTFIAKQDGMRRVRKCIPYDYGISNTDKNRDIKYHLLDLDSPRGIHPLPLEPNQIIDIQKLDECFEPLQYIHWTPNWNIARDWGIYS